MRRLLPLLGILVLLAVPCLGKSQDKTYSIKCAVPFQITLPSDWVQIPDRVLQREVAASAATIQGSSDVSFSYGFQVRSQYWFERPYTLVEVTESPKGREMTESVVKSFVAMYREGLSPKQVRGTGRLKGQTVGSVQSASFDYDPRTHLMLSEIRMPKSGKQFRMLSCRKFTKAGYLSLTFYTEPAQFEKQKSLLYRIAKSLRVDGSLEVGNTAGQPDRSKR